MAKDTKEMTTTTANTELAERAQSAPATLSSSDPIFGMLFDTNKFAQLQRVASMYAASGLVPDSFKGNVAACAVGLQMAMHMNVSPFMLFQRLYIVHGKPGVEAQFAIGLANARGVFSGPISYEIRGEGERRTCTARAVLAKSNQPVEMTIGWDTVVAEGWLAKPGSKWKTMADQMFRYRTAMWLIRLHCPEVLMGMYSAEELHDMVIDVTPGKPEKTDDRAASALRGGGDMVMGKGTTDKGTEGDPNASTETGQGSTEFDQPDLTPHSDTFDALIIESGLRDAHLKAFMKSASRGKDRAAWNAEDYDFAIKLIAEHTARVKARAAKVAEAAKAAENANAETAAPAE